MTTSLTYESSLQAYYQIANAHPFLTVEEEQKLARKLKYENCLDSARILVLSHLRLVMKVAKQYSGYGLPEEDLIQEGNIGLMKAVKKFDPDNGTRLMSYAIPSIKSAILEYILDNWRIVKIATTHAYKRLFFNLRKLKEQLGTTGEDEVKLIAEKLDVKPEEVREMDLRFQGGDVAIYEKGEDDFTAPINWLADTRYEPASLLEDKQSDKAELVKQMLDGLDERSREIVKARWLEDKGQTLSVLAERYGVSMERIRQIEVAAFKKMKKGLV